MRGIKSISDCEVLQADLLKIYNWADEVNMHFNADKFECFGDLREHIRNKHEEVSKTKKILGAKLKELEQKISEQQLDVTLKLFSLREKEIKEQKTCRCR